MKKLFSFLFFSLLISNILCDDPAETPEATPETPAETPEETPEETPVETPEEALEVEANAYGGACTTDPDTCEDTSTQVCSNNKCACKSGYAENSKKDGCVEIVGYGKDCTNKACAASQTCDSNNKCVCATGYKENSDKSGCEKDSSDSYSPFIKNSLMILLGITVF